MESFLEIPPPPPYHETKVGGFANYSNSLVKCVTFLEKYNAEVIDFC